MGLIHYELPDDLHRRLKMEAAARGTTLKALIIELLARALDAEGTAGRPRGTDAD